MKRGDILDAVKRTITQDRNNRHGEPENSFPAIAEAWQDFLRRAGWVAPEDGLKPSDAAEMLAIFKGVRLETQPYNPDNEHDRLGYYAIAAELRAIENEPEGMPGQEFGRMNRIETGEIKADAISNVSLSNFNRSEKINGIWVNRVLAFSLSPKGNGTEGEVIAVMNVDRDGNPYHDFYMWENGRWLEINEMHIK